MTDQTEPEAEVEPVVVEAMPDEHRKILVEIAALDSFDIDTARTLPPWDGVLLARVACKAGVLTADVVAALVAEAQLRDRQVDGNESPAAE